MTTKEHIVPEHDRALVTGGNTGIGFEICRQLAEADVHVLLGSRDATKGTRAAEKLRREGLDVTAVIIDVTAQSTLDEAADFIALTYGHLDILVNNAGVSIGIAPPTMVQLADLRQTFETNVFGVVATTNTLLPVLRRAEHPRIVNVSSNRGSLAGMTSDAEQISAPNLAYQSSKAALNAVTLLYSRELEGEGFTVNAIDPGCRAPSLRRGQPSPEGAGDPAEGARQATRIALAGPDAPTGTFTQHGGTPIPW